MTTLANNFKGGVRFNFHCKRGLLENEENNVEKGVHMYQLDRYRARVHLGVMAVCLVLVY